MEFTDAMGGGLGSTPFGTFFGAGGGGLWGLFSAELNSTRLEVICENCQRPRSSKTLGGIAVFGSYMENSTFYVVASDVARPAACYHLRFDGPGGSSFKENLYLDGLTTPPPLYADLPDEYDTSHPVDAELVDTVLWARVPEIANTGEYTVTLVDRCCGCEKTLVVIELEAPPMLIKPADGELTGAPVIWRRNFRPDASSAQPASSHRETIPFDKCTVVVEYDARLNTLPADQNWVYQGDGSSGDWGMAEGQVLRGITSPALSSYWERVVSVTDVPPTVYAYSSFLLASVSGSTFGDGLDFQALVGETGQPYVGVRYTARDELVYMTRLDDSAEYTPWSSAALKGWISAGGADASGAEALWIDQQHMQLEDATRYETVTPNAAANEIIVRFGDVNGVGITAYLRNFVVSAPGRFIRPLFAAFTQVTDPIVRVYTTADANISSEKSARFKLLYGPGGGNPYQLPATAISLTASYPFANSIVELTFGLSGLTANQPFWFTLERDWSHTDDKIDTTVHMHHATVRAY